jgi:hypothetical protein
MAIHAISDNPLGDNLVAVYQRKTILTDAQIKALPLNYIEVVPAPGVGKALVFHQVLIVFKSPTAAPYDNLSGDDHFIIAYGDFDKEVSDLILFVNTTLTKSFATARPTATTISGGSWLGYGNTTLDDFDRENMPFKLCMTTSTEFTGDTADNTLEVTVFYSIIDL